MDVLGNSENARIAFELNSTGGVGSKPDLSGLNAKPGHDVVDGPTLIELSDQEFSVRRVLPDS